MKGGIRPADGCSQADFAAALLTHRLRCPGGLATWNGSDPAPRLAVYRNNFVSSLVDALAATVPVVQELVGEEFFRAMAGEFVRRTPPRSRVLAFYGEALPAFIRGFVPARSVPYLADVAMLEIARVRACHAADAEPLSGEQMARAIESGDRIGELQFIFHPSVSVVSSPYAVVSLWAAHQGTGDLGAVDPFEPEAALVVRSGLEVAVVRLAAGAAGFVDAASRHASLGAAASLALAAEPAFDLRAVVSLLVSHRALISIHLPGRLRS